MRGSRQSRSGGVGGGGSNFDFSFKVTRVETREDLNTTMTRVETREDLNTTISGPSSARQRSAIYIYIYMAFRWRADDGPTLKAGLVAL